MACAIIPTHTHINIRIHKCNNVTLAMGERNGQTYMLYIYLFIYYYHIIIQRMC